VRRPPDIPQLFREHDLEQMTLHPDAVLLIGAYFAPFALSMAGIVCRII
jgi:hypothetical protein